MKELYIIYSDYGFSEKTIHGVATSETSKNKMLVQLLTDGYSDATYIKATPNKVIYK